MLLDRKIFDDLMKTLFKHHKRSLSPFVLDCWYGYCSKRLDTKQFAHCVKNSVLFDIYLPTADKFILPGLNYSESKTLEKWNLIITNSNLSSSKLYQKLDDPVAFYVLSQIGGIYKVSSSNTFSELPKLKETFLKMYLECIENNTHIPPVQFSDDIYQQKQISDDDLITPLQLQELRAKMKSLGNF